MDEPFGALDEITRDRLNEELLQVWESTGTTIVFVTHSIYEAAFLGQKVLLLAARPGRVREMVPVTLPNPRRLAMRETPEFVGAGRPSAPRAGDLLMANQAEPVAMGGAFVEDAEAQARFVAHKRYLAWRRRLLPVVAVIAFLLLWWQAVVQFDIKPFIAPSPVAVAEVLVQRFDMLMTNLLPTAIEAICGFLLGNIAAISLATVFV